MPRLSALRPQPNIWVSLSGGYGWLAERAKSPVPRGEPRSARQPPASSGSAAPEILGGNALRQHAGPTRPCRALRAAARAALQLKDNPEGGVDLPELIEREMADVCT